MINTIDQIDAVIEKYSDMIIRIAYQNLKNQADAEDVAQEVFLKLMREEEFKDGGILCSCKRIDREGLSRTKSGR
ncbi:sigma factor [Lachnoclostridium sp.]|nr:sigma factor [Lachnoclostridium sp.]